MTILLTGLLIFFASHTFRWFTPHYRQKLISQLGMAGYKALYAVVSVVALILVIWGYSLSRAEPVVLWLPPVWSRHLAALLMLPAMILLVATYLPGTWLKARLHHPMLLAVKTWALAHLISNGTLTDVLLFGSFLIWAVAGFIYCRREDRAKGFNAAPGRASRDMLALFAGVFLYFIFAFYLHQLLIGVRPFA